MLRQGAATDSISDFSGVDPVLAGLVSSGTVAVITSSAQNPTGTSIPLNSGIYSSSRVENLQVGGIAALLPALVSAQTITASCTNAVATKIQ